MNKSFSDRHGLTPTDTEITVREDAPPELREAILMIAERLEMPADEIRASACRTLLILPNSQNWSASNVREEVVRLIQDCDWFRVYDIAEDLYKTLRISANSSVNPSDRQKPEEFARMLNQYFRERGIGWQMTNGQIVFRGSPSFTKTVNEAGNALRTSGRGIAATEMDEALRDISRRPHPDVTGAIQHSVAALECVGRDIAGEPNSTLGKLLPKLNIPPPLDTAVEKVWGYSSDKARHIREGQPVSIEEAELVVGVASAVCTYLVNKSKSAT